MELLQRILMRKLRADSVVLSQHNSTCYLDLLPREKQQPSANLWQAVTSLLTQELTQAAQGMYALLVILLAVRNWISCGTLCYMFLDLTKHISE